MKIILHLGLHKTGTTALQQSLHSARHKLRARGVLYPDSTNPRICHHFLAGLIRNRDKMPSDLLRRFKGDNEVMERVSKDTWDWVRRQCDKARPEVLILSSEEVFIDLDLGARQSFAALLGTLSTDIQPVIYVRNPADGYLSLTSQRLKFSSRLRPPLPLRIRARVERFDAEFGRPVQIAPYHRDLLKDGDIIQDFAARYLTPYLSDASILPRVRNNATASAEALAIRQQFRRGARPGAKGALAADDQRLQRMIDAIEVKAARHDRPTIKPELRAAMIRASDELLWLRDKRGVAFPDLEYASIDGVIGPEMENVTEIAQVCEVDDAWREQIQGQVLERLLARGEWQSRARGWVRGVSRRLAGG